MSVFAYTVMGLLSLIAILPCLHVISKAISSGPEVTAGNIYFWILSQPAKDPTQNL